MGVGIPWAILGSKIKEKRIDVLAGSAPEDLD
jgi:hypothetical protein